LGAAPLFRRPNPIDPAAIIVIKQQIRPSCDTVPLRRPLRASRGRHRVSPKSHKTSSPPSTLDPGSSTLTRVHGFIFDLKCKNLSQVVYHVPQPRTSTPSTQKLCDNGRRPIPRYQGGGPGQVDPTPNTMLPWWWPANLRHPRATPRDRDLPCAPGRPPLAARFAAGRRPIGPRRHRRVVLLGTPDPLLSFWFTRSMIGIESPTAHRPRVYFSNTSMAKSYDPLSPSNRAAGLLLCRLIGPQHRRLCVHFVVASTASWLGCVTSSGHNTTACVHITVASTSPSHAHRRLCCAIFATPSVCTRSSSVDWVFIIELPQLVSSLSTKAGRQSTKGYTHGSRLIGGDVRDNELDDDERQTQGFI
jgi:hypothetical protein